MATPQSPFPFLDTLLRSFSAGPTPAQWLIDGVHHRAVLFLNHVLGQEPQATERLARQKGRVARVQWRQFSIPLLVTPAGLLDVASVNALPDLTIVVTDESPLDLARAALRGGKPAIRIEGDVQLAADIHWLADNVRWDAEEDLSRVIGDVPAHTLARAARGVAEALRRFVGAARPQAADHRKAVP
ncbi:ubiquinone biosynthesis accessory factor UbiJ [Xylophilus sp.]|uniref:ubiquinone biosynthesis accessory factor UbiJ n=1 Tax=Xylophilus sp. TaxID=2653893 RepID=UPI0013BDCC97|nr:hypothetical protein [Xylophilus sp.]KAF1042438.1 MAG: hypothetical protein GAK38_04321 [Xylophilus sp.]